MPALKPVPGVAKIVIVQTLAGVTVNNVLHAWQQNSAGWSQSELDTLASTVRAQWVTSVIPLQSASLTLTDVVCTDLTTDISARSIATGSTAGGAGGTAVPANACVCWSWKIANRYRGGHPRTYIAGLITTYVSNANTITTSHATSHTTAANAIRTAVNGVSAGGSTAVLGCVSYYKDKAERPSPIFRAYTGVSVDTRIDSQRRRLGRDRT